MGCGSSVKVHVIPEKTSSVKLDQLPIELLHKIFDELDISHIYPSLYCASKFLRHVVSLYNRFHFNMKLMSYRSLEYISSNILAEQITSLTLVNDLDTPLLLDLFLQKFSLDAFIQLRTITLFDIDDQETINRILLPIAEVDTCKALSRIQITNQDESYDEVFLETIKSILSKNSLRTLYSDLSYGRGTSNPLTWPDHCAMRHLIFHDSCSISFLRTIFRHTPNLETLLVTDLDFDDEIDLNHPSAADPNDDDDASSISSINSSSSDSEDDSDVQENVPANVLLIPSPPPPPPLPQSPLLAPQPEEQRALKKERFEPINFTGNLKSLTINSCTFSMSKIEWLLQEFSSLKRFRLLTALGNSDEWILDGILWSQLVPQLDTFQFIFTVNSEDSTEFRAQDCLKKFQTPFWLEEKTWFVALEQYAAEVILYTLPYLSQSYIVKERSSSFEYHTTLPDVSHPKFQSMDHVHELCIDVHEISNASTDVSIIPHFACASQLYLYGEWSRSSRSILENITKFVELSSVEELRREDTLPTVEFEKLLKAMPHLQSIRTTTTLLDSLNAAKFSYGKRLRSLTVYSSDDDRHVYVNIEPFCTMFPRIQYLTIPVNNVESCQYALDQLKSDLIKAAFHYAYGETSYDDSDNNDEQNPDLFSTWAEELQEQYRVSKNARCMHIWLR